MQERAILGPNFASFNWNQLINKAYTASSFMRPAVICWPTMGLCFTLVKYYTTIAFSEIYFLL